ncbi:hypothetical protein Tco_0247196, partial [Tanacetum coccineum]
LASAKVMEKDSGEEGGCLSMVLKGCRLVLEMEFDVLNECSMEVDLQHRLLERISKKGSEIQCKTDKTGHGMEKREKTHQIQAPNV